MLPSRSSLDKCAANVEANAETLFPLKCKKVKSVGEVATWEPEQVISNVFKAYGLEEAAKTREVMSSTAADGTQVIKRTNMKIAGFHNFSCRKSPNGKQSCL